MLIYPAKAANLLGIPSRPFGWLAESTEGFALLHCVSSYPTPMDQANLCSCGQIGHAEITR